MNEDLSRLKFRAWSKTLKKMLIPLFIPTGPSLNPKNPLMFEDPAILPIPLADLIVSQCCGLCDGNKNWIFEGDIVSVESHDALIFHLPVVFVHGSFGVLRGREFITFLDLKTRLKVETVVIIGNVYENAELLNMRDPFLKDFKKSKPN
jgi:hypothetical protein